MDSDSAGATISGNFPNSDNTETLNLNTTKLYSSAISSISPQFPPPKPTSSSPSIPNSKRIPKTNFIVDLFRLPHQSFSVAFFLSHFHSDHYSGLSSTWSKGIIYCSHKTARLVEEILQVPSHFVFALHMNQMVKIEVVLIEANHCPGAVQLRFDSFLNGFVGCDGVFLDTTYSTYVVGKEKILGEIARRYKRKIVVDARKMSILSVLGCGEEGMFTEDVNESDVHVVGWNVLGVTWPYFRPNFVKMNEIMVERGYDKVVGFVPTGWTYEVKRNKFAARVIPTVGVDIEKLDSKEVNKMQKHFSGLVDEMANKKDFLLGFYRQSYQKNEKSDVDIVSRIAEVYEEEEKNACEDSGENVPSSRGPLFHDTTPSSDSRLLVELRDSLPAWVTEEQLLDLIKKHVGNPVEISTCPHVQAIQKGFELPRKMNLTKGTISPGKRGKSSGSKSNKKAKKDPKSKPVGPRQPTTFKFFNKVLDSGSNFVDSVTEECISDRNMVYYDATEAFKEVTDQFIDIVNGSESIRDYAASIIDEAKGDINRALNIYYSNPIPGEGGLSSKSIQFSHCPEACSS
ncbi:Ribonuclease Z/Hydroxyacylglutathione hydrolase-like [Arabidopsis thaliana x Arabidopsis arenosa]|uniref:Ribonuclease Z/Hydroxyacylglutathione hydrolase-like n=1 Tax=Arabidopsis thaliana x Arabidopsis arenosa TaxID=1240361 RepID=A0A8T2F3A7_9BRAS|nr:Ribonuclease Z/Hydroxyacylglutathione hydrolase-like [Arabidopsis thaliana x Arabidopsis arenosa]